MLLKQGVIRLSQLTKVCNCYGEAKNPRAPANTVHSKKCGTDYVVRQTLILAAPGGPEAGAPLLHTPQGSPKPP